MKLAEALLRRKELQDKLARMEPINRKDLFRVVNKRININADGKAEFDELISEVPIISWGQFQAEYNYYAKQLRLIDALIQRANWETDVFPPDGTDLTTDWTPPNPTQGATP